MMRVCDMSVTMRDGRARGKEGKRTTRGVDCWVVNIGDGETELRAGVPSFWCGFGVCVVEIDGYHVVRLAVGVAHWE